MKPEVKKLFRGGIVICYRESLRVEVGSVKLNVFGKAASVFSETMRSILAPFK